MDDRTRYRKQIRFSGIGADGQKKLRSSRVLLVGCGALGCVTADQLARAGVGELHIADRDIVELSNLQRQSLFTEQDAREGLPKAVAAVRRLEQVNSTVRYVTHIVDVDHRAIGALTDGIDLILDGTDNFETRYLLNDVSLDRGIPWIFTGCTGSTGQVMPVLPGRTACLQCVIPEPPPPGGAETCDTAGILGPAVGTAASLQAGLALKILSGRGADIAGQMTVVDVWEGRVRCAGTERMAGRKTCPACLGDRRYLNGTDASDVRVLCGSNAIQVSPAGKLCLSLEELGRRLESAGKVWTSAFLTRVLLEESSLEMSVFPDGRAIIRGTEDPAVARGIYSRYIGV